MKRLILAMLTCFLCLQGTLVRAQTRPAEIAIVIDDFGLDQKKTVSFTALPKEITLAFFPHGRYTRQELPNVAKAGRGTLLHILMEPSDIGEGDTLFVRMSEREIAETLRKLLNTTRGYTGVSNHIGQDFLRSEKAMAVVMRELKRRDLFFLDSYAEEDSKASVLGQKEGVVVLKADSIFDKSKKNKTALEELVALEKIAQEKGVAISVGHAKYDTLKALQEWIPMLEGKNIKLVPIRELAERERKRK